MTQEELAEMLGIPINAISKIESGSRSLAQSEKKLLDLYFFGKLPEGIIRPSEELWQTLDFTDQEWKIVQTHSNRAGQTPAQWIRTQILGYLAYSAAAQDTPDQKDGTAG